MTVPRERPADRLNTSAARPTPLEPQPAAFGSSVRPVGATVADDGAPAAAAVLPPGLHRRLRAAVWLIPAWALMLAASTVTHQPDYETDFVGYADYVSTTPFLVSHLLFSIVGAALGAVGAAALGVRLAWSPASRSALWGASVFAASQVITASVFGVAAFFQPAVGRLHRDGARAAAEAVNSDVYGPELIVTVVTGLLLMVVGAVLLGRATVRSGIGPMWAGKVIAWGVPVFVLAGFTVQILQPVAGLAVAVAGVALARAIWDETGVEIARSP